MQMSQQVEFTLQVPRTSSGWDQEPSRVWGESQREAVSTSPGPEADWCYLPLRLLLYLLPHGCLCATQSCQTEKLGIATLLSLLLSQVWILPRVVASRDTSGEGELPHGDLPPTPAPMLALGAP